MSFFAALREQQLTHKTIKCYLSAVSHLHIQYGHEDPFASALPQLTYVLSGVRRTQGERHTRQRLSITPMELRSIKTVWSQQSLKYDTLMLWAALLHGFLRFSEGGRIHLVIIVCLLPPISPHTSRYYDRFSREPNNCASAPQAVKDRPLPLRCRCLSWTERQ